MDKYFLNNLVYKNNKRIRTRFAPSPTGPLHIGGVRTALYNYLFARKYKGDFILRIEDTDSTRYVIDSEEYIIESLNWLGIDFDESPQKGGEFFPYKQSQRTKIYTKFIKELLDLGAAYYAFDTVEDLDIHRQNAQKSGKINWKYDKFNRVNMKNSLTLSKDEVRKKIENGEKYVIRIKFPDKNIGIRFFDLIRGWVNVFTEDLDDKVLIKEDGTPTYHFANVVDDHLMKITHVIRGEEWLPSTPLHFYIYDVLGWDKPEFAHLPLILNPDGKGKLSKREADKYNIPVFPINWNKDSNVFYGYREKGFLPEALKNILALLGWSPGDNREIMSEKDLIDSFDLNKVSKSPAKFDYKKAIWINHKYIHSKRDEELINEFIKIVPYFDEVNKDKTHLKKIIKLAKERAFTLLDLRDELEYFFYDPKYNDLSKVKESIKILEKLLDTIKNIRKFDIFRLEELLNKFIIDNGLSFYKIGLPLRVALTGRNKGPSIIKVAELLGKQETIKRINMAIKKAKNESI